MGVVKEGKGLLGALGHHGLVGPVKDNYNTSHMCFNMRIRTIERHERYHLTRHGNNLAKLCSRTLPFGSPDLPLPFSL